MEGYDPACAPDAKAWLALEEDERIALVEEHHRQAGIRVPNAALHSAIHAIVENQAALGDELPVQWTIERLVREGLNRHDAVHAVGMELMLYLQELKQFADRTPPGRDDGSLPDAALARYKSALQRLTAERWRASRDDTGAGWPTNLEDALGDLRVSRDLLPEASMQWLLDNWDQAAPRLLRMLDDFLSGADRSDGAANALFLAVHLLGEKGETRAFHVLCGLLMDPDAEEVLGDAITESLNSILISTFDGDRLTLRRVIESDDADPFSRHAALDAMAYLTRTGRIPEEETRAYLGALRHSLEPGVDSILWAGWAAAIANLGYPEFEGEVETLLRTGNLDPDIMDLDWFRSRLRRVRDDPAGIAGFADDGIGPFEDAIGTLASWSSFAEEDLEYDDAGDGDTADKLPPWPVEGQPHVNPMRDVGRNDPCPCGSGKKYKKCCLR